MILVAVLVKRKKKKRKSSSKKKKKPKKKKKTNRKKKENQPDQELHILILWKKKRQEIADKNPIASFGEIAKLLGKKWKEDITPEEKEKYIKLADEDKVRYNKEKDEWSGKDNSSSSSQSGKKKKIKKRKKKKNPNAPKRPINSFLLYSRQFRPKVKEDPQYKDLDNTSIGKKVGELWRNLSPEEKKPFVDAAEIDKERYNREMKEYNAKNGKE